MPKKESLQHKIDRVRPPRVQITYDVETGGALELKELPFVVGILGDFVGKSEEPLPAIKNRKFVEIDPDNFNQVLAGMKPRLAYTLDNKLQDDGSKMGVELKFKSIEDFEPDNVVQQIEPSARGAAKIASAIAALVTGGETLTSGRIFTT